MVFSISNYGHELGFTFNNASILPALLAERFGGFTSLELNKITLK